MLVRGDEVEACTTVLADGAGAVLLTGEGQSGRSTALAEVASRWPHDVWRSGTDRGDGVVALVRRHAAAVRALEPGARGVLDALVRGDAREPATIAAALRELAADGRPAPLLWCIDDLDALPPEDAAIIDACARGSRDGPLRVVATSTEARNGWDEVSLGPVDREAIAEVLTADAGLAVAAARDLAALAGGGPGVAADVVPRLGADQRDGSDALPVPLPLGPRAVARVRCELERLADADRAEALTSAAGALARRAVAAADGAPGDGHPWRADACAHVAAVDEWRAACDRAAVIAAADDHDHEALVLRAWAAAGEGEGLHEAARAALGHGTLRTALALLAAAFEVAGPDSRVETARMAASVATLAGLPGAGERWAARARAASDVAPVDAVLHAAGGRDEDPAQRRQALREAVALADDAPAARRVPLEVHLIVFGQAHALPGVLDDVERLEALLGSDGGRHDALIRFCGAIARRLVQVDGASRAVLDAAGAGVRAMLAAPDQLPDGSRPTAAPTVAALWLAIVALADERWHEAEQLLTEVERIEHEQGWTRFLASTRAWKAEAAWRRGDADSAMEAARAAMDSRAATPVAAALATAVVDRAHGLAGSPDDAPLELAPPPRSGGLGLALWHHGQAVVALGRADAPGALAHLFEVAALTEGALAHPGLVWWRVDMVEALTALGRDREADAHLVDLEACANGLEGPLARSMVLRAQAARAAGRAATRVLERAVRTIKDVPYPFEVARTRLALAAARAAVGDEDRARDVAREVQTAFVSLGATGYAARAAALAGGAQSPALGSLSERARAIAQRVARGETNRQIASALHLSEKTVEFHLGKAYRTLGISGRAELAALIAGDEGQH